MSPKTNLSAVPGASRTGRRTLGLVAFLVAALICVIAAELMARAFWYQRGVPFNDPGRILYAYYPELKAVDEARPRKKRKYYDILFLGASVLNREWGEVEQALLEQLDRSGHPNVRIFNLAVPAHTSRDSWLKYSALGKAPFDLVVFYHGINETRANNAPPTIFRDDYSHFSWYETANMLAGYHGKALFALPYTLRYLALNIKRAIHDEQYVPVDWPRDEWLKFGREPRSAASFKNNLSAILERSARRCERMLVMTFATYIPPDTHWGHGGKRFGLRRAPVTLWGRRGNVLKALHAQNEVVRSLASKKHTLFVDQANLMDHSPRSFNDPCHLTIEGSAQFAKNIVKVLLPER
jgi:hypothetical protein